MKRMLVLLAAAPLACGSTSKPPPAPISNREAASTGPNPGDARLVMRASSGGVLELTGDHDAALAVAYKQMAAHCGANQYTITQEGEEAIGTNTTAASPRTVTAWRVHYQCNHLIDL